MKIIILYISLFFSFQLLGQNNISINDCGHWEIDSIIIETISSDTIKYNSEKSDNWIYSDWINETNNVFYAVYCPCGCGWDKIEYSNRISDKGIIQKIKRITSYKYIPKPKSEYDIKLEKLKNIR